MYLATWVQRRGAHGPHAAVHLKCIYLALQCHMCAWYINAFTHVGVAAEEAQNLGLFSSQCDE